MPLSKAELERNINSLEQELSSAELEVSTEGDSVKYRPISEIRQSIRYFKKELDTHYSVTPKGRHRAYRVMGNRGL